MVGLTSDHIKDDQKTICRVIDCLPDSNREKISIVVRPSYTVDQVYKDIATQFNYKSFDLKLEARDVSVSLSDKRKTFLYDVPGFEKDTKNILYIMPTESSDKENDTKVVVTTKKIIKKTTKKTSSSSKSKTTSNSNSNSTTNLNSNSNQVEIISKKSITTTSTTTLDGKSSVLNSTTTLPKKSTCGHETPAYFTSEHVPLKKDESDSEPELKMAQEIADPTWNEFHPVIEIDENYMASMLPSCSDSIDTSLNDFVASPNELVASSNELVASSNELVASPNELEDATPAIPTAPALPMYDTKAKDPKMKLKLYSSPRPTSRYVGLVNQAMTCYLNSLLQALFMTPEFRNALYNWEFDGIDEAKSIPYQLQKLFLNLQTSQKVAVETTDLTRSFGWDSTEAWQQHDIQELCRVMFDALEQKFKNTDQADLINRLYEGKMIDYVKCLECCTEKSREDTFLDIPLPVRPFGSSVAYGSIEEALRAFVQPETLVGNNQYYCEKCNKKCDAHKGLKFKKFPYILTLHLKRFDFDYQTLHRIKLNDKVTFPQTLNLNSFINATDVETFGTNHVHTNGFASSASSEHDATENLAKCDDSSTTDSGAVMEDDNCSGIATTASSSHNDNDLQDDDEGIDVSTSTDHRISISNANGPYVYELFAIMIHSGSASGGHYYAYIKDFDNGEWYCFNDQTVSPITQEDIQKSFGGGSFKAYYSSIYSSSTNAYMLMYRQLDPKQNANVLKASDFPDYINQLVKCLDDKDEETRQLKTREPDVLKPKVYLADSKSKTPRYARVFTPKSGSMESVLESAYNLLDVGKHAPLANCRLVAYEHLGDEILFSLEGREKEPIENFTDLDFLLETRANDEEFEKYEPNGIMTRVYKIDMKTHDVDGPYFVRAIRGSTIENFKKLAAKKLKIKWNEMMVAIERYSDVAIMPLDTETGAFYPLRKIFVRRLREPSTDDCQHFLTIANSFNHLMYLHVIVPVADNETLQLLAIPPYVPRSQQPNTPKQSPSEDSKQLDGGDVVDAVMMNSATNISSNDVNIIGASGDFKRISPLPPHSSQSTSENCCSSATNAGVGGAESNSEDSSLSDGDRTLVESAPHNLSHSSTPSHSPQLSSPEDENEDKLMMGCRGLSNHVSDDEDCYEADSDLYFRACRLVDESEQINGLAQTNGNVSDSEDLHATRKSYNTDNIAKESVQNQYTLKVLVDNRMRLGTFKRNLEPHIQVNSEYFRIVQKQTGDLKHFYLDMSEKMRLFRDGDEIGIELGRNLKKGEHKAKLYYLKLSEITNEIGKLDPICERVFNDDSLLTEVKRDFIQHLHNLDSKYKTLTIKNCRFWERSGKNPLKILPADSKSTISDLGLSISCEIVLQECENGVSLALPDESMTLFVRRWHPSTLELDPFQEITLAGDTDIRKLFSDLSNIPQDNIAYLKVNSSFPATNISLLNINGSMTWFTNPATIENYPISISHSGCVYFYKDNNESPKELNSEDRRELQAKEKSRLERIGASTTSAYSPRRERALKIYLDTSPKGRDD